MLHFVFEVQYVSDIRHVGTTSSPAWTTTETWLVCSQTYTQQDFPANRPALICFVSFALKYHAYFKVLITESANRAMEGGTSAAIFWNGACASKANMHAWHDMTWTWHGHDMDMTWSLCQDQSACRSARECARAVEGMGSRPSLRWVTNQSGKKIFHLRYGKKPKLFVKDRKGTIRPMWSWMHLQWGAQSPDHGSSYWWSERFLDHTSPWSDKCDWWPRDVAAKGITSDEALNKRAEGVLQKLRSKEHVYAVSVS